MTGLATRSAAAATVALGAVACVVALHRMDGMDMGYATELGSAGSFAVAWISMMAAMMLPGAVPAAMRHAGRVPAFVAGYLAVWAAVGVAVYALYRPHGAVAAGAVTVAAGLYELTPLKRDCRRHCREYVRSGLELGVHCVGSSIGLMAMFVALGVMNVVWMAVVAAVLLIQKLLPPRATIDVPVALTIVGLGILIVV